VTLLVGAGALVLFGLVWLLFFAATAASPQPGLGVALAVPPVLGLLALAAWLYIKVALATPAVVLEKVGPLQGLAGSWRLVRGSWWRLFGILLLATIVGISQSVYAVMPGTWKALEGSTKRHTGEPDADA